MDPVLPRILPGDGESSKGVRSSSKGLREEATHTVLVLSRFGEDDYTMEDADGSFQPTVIAMAKHADIKTGRFHNNALFGTVFVIRSNLVHSGQ